MDMKTKFSNDYYYDGNTQADTNTKQTNICKTKLTSVKITSQTHTGNEIYLFFAES